MSNVNNLQKPATGPLALRVLIAALGAAIINNLYSIGYTAVTGFSIPEVINAFSVTTFSVVPVLVGGVVYWIASRYSVKLANVGLTIGTIILFILFYVPSFGETITTPQGTMEAPDGFAWLSFGLHFAGPILLLALVPEWRRKSG
ncbi:MAG: hypothetical protein LC641_09160 [Spirochaeta sp.]|nr:hypothetical protein [Spirochaeta sp.]